MVTRYVQDGWNPALAGTIGNSRFNVLADLDGSNVLQMRYTRGDKIDQLVARIEGGGTAYWELTDRQGSVRNVIDNTGVVKDAVSYDGFGNITSETNSTFRGRYTWTGRDTDLETKLQFNRARWYDPLTGRWISRDPLGFDAGDTNLYRYVTNHPTSSTDPSGQELFVIGESAAQFVDKTGSRLWGTLPGPGQWPNSAIMPRTPIPQPGQYQHGGIPLGAPSAKWGQNTLWFFPLKSPTLGGSSTATPKNVFEAIEAASNTLNLNYVIYWPVNAKLPTFAPFDTKTELTEEQSITVFEANVRAWSAVGTTGFDYALKGVLPNFQKYDGSSRIRCRQFANGLPFPHYFVKWSDPSGAKFNTYGFDGNWMHNYDPDRLSFSSPVVNPLFNPFVANVPERAPDIVFNAYNSWYSGRYNIFWYPCFTAAIDFQTDL